MAIMNSYQYTYMLVEEKRRWSKRIPHLILCEVTRTPRVGGVLKLCVCACVCVRVCV